MNLLPPPATIEATGVDFSQLLDLALKTLRYGGRISGGELARRMGLSFTIIDSVLGFLKREKLVEVVGSQGITETQYEYALSDKGYEKATEALERNQYVGPAPVPLREYVKLVKSQSIRSLRVTPPSVHGALGDLELSANLRRLIGAAVNGGHSILLYGKPGNGKSSIAKRIVKMLGGSVLIPYAVDVGGQTIRVFDPRVHSALPLPQEAMRRHDGRWVVAERPLITVGGELMLDDLDLKYSSQTRYYLAPIQILANCGILLIDDFGRQKMRPKDLLNRWIVPMEDGADHYSLVSGETIEVPFELLLVFSTNLQPEKLGDEAFWRRIRHKVEVSDPDEGTFLQILKSVCDATGIAYRPEGGRYLLDHHYAAKGREFRAVHPRDLVGLLMDMSGFEGVNAELTPEWIDVACASYFLQEDLKSRKVA